MCFYCWKCSPQNVNNPKDGYYRMTICCFSKNILPSIIWLFSIRLIFDIIFTIIFVIFNIPFFIFFTLIVAVALIAAILGFTFKLIWIYYCFGFLTIILSILDLGSLSYIIYSIADGNGWLYNYAYKHISKKSDESLFTINDRIYTATDIILFVFAIFLFISFLHDLTNLLMINRSIKYLKRFSSNSKRTQQNLTHMDSNRNSFRNGITSQTGNGRYTKRSSVLSIPSIVAPQTPRLSYIEISPEPITPRATTIPYPQQQRQQQQSEHPTMLVNDGYSFVETILSRRRMSNTASVAVTTTPGYEIPQQHPLTAPNEYESLNHAYEMDNRIQVQDIQSPFSDSNKKDSKNEKTRPIQPKEVPPIPPKSLTQSSRSQNSESSSFIYRNMVYNDEMEPQNYAPISTFIPIAFNPSNTERANTDSLEDSDISSIDSSFDKQLTSKWDTEAKVKHENQNQSHFSKINPELASEQPFTSYSQQSSSKRDTETTIRHERQLAMSENETHYSNINSESLLGQRFGNNPQQAWITNINVTSTEHESYQNMEKNQILSTNSATHQNDILYSNTSPPLPPRRRYGISNRSNDEIEPNSNPVNVLPAESVIEEKGHKNDDTISFTSNDSNDVVSFWSHHPSTRRRRTSQDLLNKKGFLSDESSEEEKKERIPKLLPTATNKQQPLKSFGLTQILQLEKRENKLPSAAFESNENEKQETKEIRSDSLIFALESIKIMEKGNEDDDRSPREYQKIQTSTERHSETMEQREYGRNYQSNETVSQSVTHSNYENIPYKSSPDEIKALCADLTLKRESLTFNPDEIRKTESNETFVTPTTHFQRIIEVKKEATMTPETPIIPSTSNFFDAWGKAAERSENETKTTVPFNIKSTKIDESEESNVTIVREESDSDSTMSFSSSSSDEDSESDIDKRMIKLKQKIQAHLPQTLNQNNQNVTNIKVLPEAELSYNDTVTTVEHVSSSSHEEIPQPFKFRRLPLIGNASENPTTTEVFSTPPTSPIYQIPSTNFPQLPSLPKMPPPPLPPSAH